MSSNQKWGRKETIVWPPHAPIYTFSALALGVFATLFFVWQFLRFTETPLRRTYTPTYIQSLVGATLKQHGKYRLLYVGGGKAAPRLALPADFVSGETKLPNGVVFPAELSEAARHQGHTVFYRGPEKDYIDAALSRWLRSLYFDGQGLLEIYATSLGEGFLVLVIALAFAGRADVKRFRGLKYGRHLKGPVMVSPAQFNKALKADGLTIETSGKPWFLRKPIQLRIPRSAEAKHIQIMGDTGTGKSTLIKQLLQQIADRGEIWIIREYFKQMGIQVVACLTGDGRVDDIRMAHGAALNLVQCSGSMMHLAKTMEEKWGTPYLRVSYFGIEDMAKALYDVAQFFKDRSILERTQDLVRQQLETILPQLEEYKEALQGKKAAIYVGGAFKAFSLVRALRSLGMQTVLVGSQTGNREDYEQLLELCDQGTIIVDDTNPLELVSFLEEKNVDLFIGGVKERPIAFKLGVGFCDHNHERKEALAGFEGMLNFAREVHASVLSPVWSLTPRKRSVLPSELPV